jgi:hypothetical protein
LNKTPYTVVTKVRSHMPSNESMNSFLFVLEREGDKDFSYVWLLMHTLSEDSKVIVACAAY